jgi:hypothetical protein
MPPGQSPMYSDVNVDNVPDRVVAPAQDLILSRLLLQEWDLAFAEFGVWYEEIRFGLFLFRRRDEFNWVNEM